MGKIEWESSEVDKPRCVSRYRENLVLAANSKSVSALDLQTGKITVYALLSDVKLLLLFGSTCILRNTFGGDAM